MELSKLREILKEKYYPIDAKSSALFLLSVLFEEVGELAESVRKKDVKRIEEELADVFFMVLSLANYFELDIEAKLIEKYIKGDPRGKWDLEK